MKIGTTVCWNETFIGGGVAPLVTVAWTSETASATVGVSAACTE